MKYRYMLVFPLQNLAHKELKHCIYVVYQNINGFLLIFEFKNAVEL